MIATCAHCHAVRSIKARGLCDQCHRMHSRRGVLSNYPSVRKPPLEVPDDWRDADTGGDWAERGECRKHDPELFFAPNVVGRTSVDGTPPLEHPDRTKARRICETCPVRAECLRYAIETHQEYGIWGGLDEKERKRLKRRTAS